MTRRPFGEKAMLAAAIRYAHAGWPVFPCKPGGKEPAIPSAHREGDPARGICTGECGRDGHGFHDATCDTDKVSWCWGREPGRNIGIATGAPGPDVLDIDVHKEGNGFAAFNKLIRAGLVDKPIAVVRTPRGGIHAYYSGTEHQGNGHIPAVHVDFRSRGGYVVAPPSTVAGRTYQVVSHEPSKATFDWDKARELLDPKPEPARRPLQGDREGPRDVSNLARWVAAQPEGNRNAGLFWAANRAVEAGDNEALDAIAKGAADAGLGEREISKTIRSAQQGNERRPFDRAAARSRAVPSGAAPKAAPSREQEERVSPERGLGPRATDALDRASEQTSVLPETPQVADRETDVDELAQARADRHAMARQTDMSDPAQRADARKEAVLRREARSSEQKQAGPGPGPSLRTPNRERWQAESSGVWTTSATAERERDRELEAG
jgi:hypothetical protein